MEKNRKSDSLDGNLDWEAQSRMNMDVVLYPVNLSPKMKEISFGKSRYLDTFLEKFQLFPLVYFENHTSWMTGFVLSIYVRCNISKDHVDLLKLNVVLNQLVV